MMPPPPPPPPPVVAAQQDVRVGGEMAKGEVAEPVAPKWAPVREFPVPSYPADYDGPRTDFRETVFFAPSVRTNERGEATVSFPLSDAVTSFRATVEGVGDSGVVGRGDSLVASKLPVSLAAKLPLELTAGDVVELPISLTNATRKGMSARIDAHFGTALKVTAGEVKSTVTLEPGATKTVYYGLRVDGDLRDSHAGDLSLAAEAAQLRDSVERVVRLVPPGLPRELSRSGNVDGTTATVETFDLPEAVPGSLEATVSLFPSPAVALVAGTEAMLAEPSGCFEQASSTNYPNVMVVSYLASQKGKAPLELADRSKGLLDRGYKKLSSYETKSRGYEWFGADPGHEALTAYGLLQFSDMARVFPVEADMMDRTRAWLKTRRDGKGGYKKNEKALDSFGRASDEVTNAYVTYALAETGDKDISAELGTMRGYAKSTKDPYVMALATGALVDAEPAADGTKSAVARLISMEGADGKFGGAGHSITRSGGIALDIESTALAAFTLMKAGGEGIGPAKKALGWISKQRAGGGNFGSTQATVLALKALTRGAELAGGTEEGVVKIRINGGDVHELAVKPDGAGRIELTGFERELKAGTNSVEIVGGAGGVKVPYTVSLRYRTKSPVTSTKSPLSLAVAGPATTKAGEAIKVEATITNTTANGLPMVIARIGIPGGLTFQTWQLDELKEKKIVDFYETREREVIVYFRSMKPKEKRVVDLRLLAAVPGSFTAPVSQAYLYYTDEHRTFQAPLTMTVSR
jgi:hypothetical protein